MLLWIQLSRMFRGPQILTWPCHVRPVFGLRESILSATSDYTGVWWPGAADPKERRYGGIRLCKEGSPLLPETAPSSLDCGILQLRDASFQVPTSKVEASASNPGCSSVEDLAQNPKAVNTYWDCLSNTVWRRLRDMCQHSSHSFASKTRCTYLQSYLYNRQRFVRSLSLSKRNHSKLLPHSHTVHQTRAVHQAAPQVADTWRDCLSVMNENRCRQRLGPNLKLYEVERFRKGSQSKNQGRWAAVLVCLCCVRGEPAFLFTLRSSTLKGRHKGDVSFAGGKSDPSDRDVVATALREAREELGITVATDSVWGVLKPLRDMSGLMVAPVLANVGPLEELSFKPNPGEVEEIFTLSLSHLCNPHNRGYTHFRTGDKYGYTLPVFRNGKHRVWGLTAVALDHSLKLIVPS